MITIPQYIWDATHPEWKVTLVEKSGQSYQEMDNNKQVTHYFILLLVFYFIVYLRISQIPGTIYLQCILENEVYSI